MAMIDQVRVERRPEMEVGLSLVRVMVYLAVIAAGLGLGAVIGVIGALFSGLISC